MPVVAHHPVIVHLESIARCLFAVDDYLTVAHLEVIALVSTYRPLVYRYVIERQVYALSLGRDPYRAIVVASPVHVSVQRIDVPVGCRGVELYALHNILAGRERRHGPLCQRHVTGGVKALQVFHRYSKFIHQLVRNGLTQFYVIGVLHVVRLFVGLSVEIYYPVLYLQRLSGQSHAPLHIVLATIHGARVYRAVFLRVAGYV